MIAMLAQRFNEGGPFMWVILGVFSLACAVAIERAVYYYGICRGGGGKLVTDVVGLLERGETSAALARAGRGTSPLHLLVQVALERVQSGMDVAAIREGVDEASLLVLPRLGSRLNYLSLFANVATLLGLLGTIAGLQVSFSSLAAVEAAKKATMLAQGISQAMNTTAFGLVVAVPCMVLFTFLSNRQRRLLDELDAAMVRLLNYLGRRKP